MRVEEIIARLGDLGRDERDRLRAALAELELTGVTGPEADATRRRGLAAMERLLGGVCRGGGRHVSANIDGAVYRADR